MASTSDTSTTEEGGREIGKIIKCWKCGEILARVVGETAFYCNLDLYVFHLTMLGDSLRLVCDCGETASINEASITEEELVHH